eukprot:81988_1
MTRRTSQIFYVFACAFLLAPAFVEYAEAAEVEVDICDTQPCETGGTCTSNEGGYTCCYPDKYSVTNCKQLVTFEYLKSNGVEINIKQPNTVYFEIGGQSYSIQTVHKRYLNVYAIDIPKDYIIKVKNGSKDIPLFENPNKLERFDFDSYFYCSKLCTGDNVTLKLVKVTPQTQPQAEQEQVTPQTQP